MKAPRDDYLTPEGHYQEARRLLWVIDGELQSDAPRTIGELAIVALAHAVTALAADVFAEDDDEPEGQADELGEDTRRLGEIRGVLAAFDWEHDDRQLALEAIERITDGGQS